MADVKRRRMVIMSEQFSVYLRNSCLSDSKELEAAFQKSLQFHQPWTFPPDNIEQYSAQENLYLVCLKVSNEIVGAFNISEIVRGHFQSAYLGYQVFAPHQNKGYMSQGIKLLIKQAFENLKLHRLEANIQPENYSSIALVSKAGFKKEGYSTKYLRIGGSEWKGHERWAIINDNWTASL